MKHGTLTGYVKHRCRCEPCADAQYKYEKRRRLTIARTGPLLIPNVGTMRRVRALMWLGWTRHGIAQHAGIAEETLRKYLRPGVQVRRVNAEKIAAVYDSLSMRTGPSNITAGKARSLGYTSPLAWEGIDIDDPAATPDTGPTRGPGRPGLNIEDIEWVIGGGTTNLDALATRLNSTPAAISKALYRAGRIDLVRQLGVVAA